jgi:hypothetical protein
VIVDSRRLFAGSLREHLGTKTSLGVPLVLSILIAAPLLAALFFGLNWSIITFVVTGFGSGLYE